jgi:hypothetical protein
MSRDIKELSIEEIEKNISEQLIREKEHNHFLRESIFNYKPLAHKKRDRYLSYICRYEERMYFELKKLYPDLIDLNNYNPYSPVDCRSISLKKVLENKGRWKDFDDLLIEKYKWDEIVVLPDEDVFYVCATPKQVVMFDVKNLPEPIWRVEQHNKTTTFDDNDKIDKLVGFYDTLTQPHLDLTEKLFKINEI